LLRVLYRRKPIAGTLATLGAGEYFDVVEDVASYRLDIPAHSAANPPALQQTEEAHSPVPAIPAAAQGRHRGSWLPRQQYFAFNGGPAFTFSPAISFFVNCASQKEVDALTAKLLENGGRATGEDRHSGLAPCVRTGMTAA
jgi:hypothetical protein